MADSYLDVIDAVPGDRAYPRWDVLCYYITVHEHLPYMSKEKLAVLTAGLLRAIREDGDWLIEIGAYHGETTAMIGEILGLLPTVSHFVLTIDPFERALDHRQNVVGSYPDYLATLEKYHVTDVCWPLCAFSAQAYGCLAGSYAMVCIDGSHQYQDVQWDLAHYSKKLRPHGYIWMDDYNVAYPGVIRAVDEFLAAQSYFVKVAEQDSAILLQKRMLEA